MASPEVISANVNVHDLTTVEQRHHRAVARMASDGADGVETQGELTVGGAADELTPAPCSVRSRVHEYGGGAYLPTPVGVFFVRNDDQDIHLIAPDGVIHRLTDDGVEQAGLACSIAPDQTGALATLELEADLLQKRIEAISQGNISKRKQGHITPFAELWNQASGNRGRVSAGKQINLAILPAA